MKKYIVVTTACCSLEEAHGVINILLEKRLISCAQISNIDSSYYWQGKIEHKKEYLINMKTKKELYKEIEKTIKENHSYEVPEIIAYDIMFASNEFLDWIDNETRSEIKSI